jgi:hypothetical protein
LVVDGHQWIKGKIHERKSDIQIVSNLGVSTDYQLPAANFCSWGKSTA